MAAAAGLDLSLPYLDRDLVAYLMAIPGEETTPEGVSRGIHRAAMRGVLPDTLRLRRTKGDGTAAALSDLLAMWPAVSACLAGPTKSAALDLVSAPALRRGLVDARLQLEAGNSETAWRLLDVLFLEPWLQRFF
jgi:asparagine synthase (glutamine-hydrolysing)